MTRFILRLFSLFFGITMVISCSRNNEDTLFSALDEGDTHVTFNNELSDSPDFNVMKYGYFYNGGGVAAADFNNDGFTDLYFTGNVVPDRLYIHKGGSDISYDDVTAKAGLGRSQGWKTGVSVVDINSDGWMDIYVCRSAAESAPLRSNLLYINNGDLTFTEKAEEYGLADKGYSTQAVFFDYDRDGDLDCFILNHSIQKYAGFSQQLASLKNTEDPNYGSRLMRNDQNRFADVSREAGLVSNVLSFGLGVIVSDLNDDNWPDIYVSNDYNEEDYLYINQKNGTFAEYIKDATPYTSLFSMGSDAADINNDGRMDIITLDMLPESNERIKMTSGDDNYEKYLNLLQSGFHRQFMRNMLQLNTGNQKNPRTPDGPPVPLFQETGQICGVSNTDWSWTALFADFDLDGRKDLFVTNGYEKDYTNMDFLNYTVALQTKIQEGSETLDELAVIDKMPSIREHNYLFKNEGEARFDNVSKAWGMTEAGVSAGAVYADLDNDGDLDLVVNNLNAAAGIYRNNSKNITSSLTINLKAPRPASVIGAKVKVHTGTSVQVQEYMPVRGFQSSSAGPLIFGIAPATTIDSLVIQWADGTIQTVAGPLKLGTHIVEQRQGLSPAALRSTPSSTFSITDAPYRHDAVRPNDFKVQPLLPYMFSSPGPRSVSTKDGTLLYVTGTKGKGGQLYTVQNGNLLERTGTITGLQKQADEADAVFIDVNTDGAEDLVVVYSDYQAQQLSPVLRPSVYIRNGQQFVYDADAIPSDIQLCAGTVVAWDYNQDGKMDLFIGSRVMPSSFPEAGESILLTNDGKGRFSVVTLGHRFPVGMVTDAVVAPVSGDALPDLVIARDFGTIAMLPASSQPLSKSGFRDISSTGCWNTVEAADLNGDGKMDIIGGNLGLNNQLSTVTDQGLQLRSYAYFGIAKAIPVIAIHESEKWYPFAARDELMSQVPVLKKKFSDYSSYAKATVTDIFGEEWEKAQQYTAESLLTSCWIQRSGGFSSGTLPIQAQYAPVYALCVTDINGDNSMDLVIGGNNVRTRVRIGDMNSSYGTVLLGRNDGTFSYMGEMGLKGEIRSFSLLKNNNQPFIFATVAQSQSKRITWK